ncbi:hypothetical protein [Gracilibacillus thailandensis]|uniref:Uncharacterized protein n=1 Tax=Gracilibacillus thailandensis TaxID=563735 RepID=A0A6N7R2M1_9BACI|nr:hypothetical protein [Gracilibacillus thailandensis]MRI65346.1 hypothetical protein [Gracilibacillus thailandensis]
MLLNITYHQIIEVPDEAFDVKEGYPGAGAIAFHRKHTGVLAKDSAEWFIQDLYAGRLPFITDSRRVKLCAYCGFYWEDDSTKNNRKTCSKACTDARRAEQKAEERARKPKAVPDKLREIDYYIDGLEYAYWSDERVMDSYIYRIEKPYDELKAQYKEHSELVHGEGNRIGSKYRGYM